MYYPRHIEPVVKRIAKRKPVVVLTGARQRRPVQAAILTMLGWFPVFIKAFFPSCTKQKATCTIGPIITVPTSKLILKRMSKMCCVSKMSRHLSNL